MAWVVVAEDNSLVSGPHPDEPQALQGQRVLEVPLRCQWSPAHGGFVDQTRWISKFAYVLLWPVEANLAVMQSNDAAMVRAWSLFTNWEGPINLDDPLVIAGITRAEQIGILTAAQALRIRNGLTPE